VTTPEHTRLLVTATGLLAVTVTVAVAAFVAVDEPLTRWTAWALWVVWFTPLWILPVGLLLVLDLLAWATRRVAPRVSWVAAGIVFGSLVAVGALGCVGLAATLVLR
jgi:hypothetical protein